MKKILITVLSVFLIFSSCSNIDFGDINNNPNGAKTPSTSSLMAGAMMRYGTLTGRTYFLVPQLYVQYTAQTVYTEEMLYNTEPRSWYGYYVQTLSNLQKIIDLCDAAGDTPDPILLAGGAINNQKGAALIMQSIIFKRLTDTYGDIPYSDAFNTESLVPKYDKQEEIYKNMIETVKQARDMMTADLPGPKGDPFYGGDVTNWKKFANSFIMACALQISNRYPDAGGYAAQEFNAALSDANGSIENVAEEAWFTYDVPNGFENPWNANRPADYSLSQEFTDALQGNPAAADTSLNPTSNTTFDARINIFSSDPTAKGQPYGFELDGSAATLSPDYIWKADAKFPLFTAAYSLLNRAEAAAMGWTNENAEDLLKQGIMTSYNSNSAAYGLDITSGAETYADARVADAGTVGTRQVICEEKWVALFPAGFDAWSEHRRTGYPNLKPAAKPLNDGNIPTRYIYPNEEPGLNGDNYSGAIADLKPAEDKNTAKVWWDN